jgi:hypothetical protein
VVLVADRPPMSTACPESPMWIESVGLLAYDSDPARRTSWRTQVTDSTRPDGEDLWSALFKGLLANVRSIAHEIRAASQSTFPTYAELKTDWLDTDFEFGAEQILTAARDGTAIEGGDEFAAIRGGSGQARCRVGGPAVHMAHRAGDLPAPGQRARPEDRRRRA